MCVKDRKCILERWLAYASTWCREAQRWIDGGGVAFVDKGGGVG